MKTFTKVLLIIAAVMMVAGCQKTDDGIDVYLKSSGVQTTVNNWKSGNAASECAASGGDCDYAFKIDEWKEDLGMDGAYETHEGNSIIILNSDGKTFDWVSEYPVCKVIVKAGRGSIIYTYPEGSVYEDSGLVGFQGKGISHVTFCFSEPPTMWVIALKTQLTFPGLSNSTGVSGGIDSDINAYHIGYNPYVLGQENTYPLMNNFVQIGTITATDFSIDGVDSLRIVIDTYNSDWGFWASYLYIGTLSGFNFYRTPWYEDRLLVNYESFPFQKSTIPEPCVFEIPFSNIIE